MRTPSAGHALLAAFLLSLGVAGCEQPITEPSPPRPGQPSTFLQSRSPAAPMESSDLSPEAVARITRAVDRVNEGLASAGSPWRLNYPWLFRVGNGVDPFGALRTGVRWPVSTVSYVLDEKDYTSDLASSVVDATLVRAYGTWNEVENTGLEAVRVPNPAPTLNLDILDGTFDASGNCLDIVDVNADNLVSYDPNTGALAWIPAADILVGGWLGADYFVNCLLDSSIIGVTWFFSFGDANRDQYADQLYVEQFYNDDYQWVTSGAALLDPRLDLETVLLHENGHSHGLGHFGGPHPRQPLLLRPNGNIFTPEAVMNAGYFGGEKRALLPPDEAGMRALYARVKD